MCIGKPSFVLYPMWLLVCYVRLVALMSPRVMRYAGVKHGEGWTTDDASYHNNVVIGGYVVLQYNIKYAILWTLVRSSIFRIIIIYYGTQSVNRKHTFPAIYTIFNTRSSSVILVSCFDLLDSVSSISAFFISKSSARLALEGSFSLWVSSYTTTYYLSNHQSTTS